MSLGPPRYALFRAAYPCVASSYSEHIFILGSKIYPFVYAIVHAEFCRLTYACLKRSVGTLPRYPMSDILLVCDRHCLRPPSEIINLSIEFFQYFGRNFVMAKILGTNAVHVPQPLIPCPVGGALDCLYTRVRCHSA